MDETFTQKLEKIAAIPIWDPNDQVTDTDEELPAAYSDKELYVIAIERTKALRELQRTLKRPPEVGGDGILWAIQNMDHQIGMHFDAHGIGMKGDPFVLLNEILTKGISKDRHLYSMPFIEEREAAGAFGADHPRTDGGIVIVSDYDKKLGIDGVKYVILDETYNRVIALMRKRYPKVEIVAWNEAPKVLTEAANKATGTHYEAKEANADTACYVKAVREMVTRAIPVPEASPAGDGTEDVF